MALGVNGGAVASGACGTTAAVLPIAKSFDGVIFFLEAHATELNRSR